MDNNEVKIIKTAILNELEGEKFYKSVARDAKNPDTAKAFLHLAEDEKRHEAMLRGMLDHLMAGSELSIDALSKQGTPSPRIFNAADSVDTDNAMEISVFHIGILMEKASMDYYRKAAQSTCLDPARELYESLADWEMRHLDEMEKIYDSLTEDWWERQGFSPS
jgi:rubrerythrin